MIEVKNLVKHYGDKRAVNDISFTVKQGEIMGFLGPNGAGKSTTMNMITGYLSSTSGTVTIDGYDILENPMEAKRQIGYLPEQPPLYLDMTVKDYLNFIYDLNKVKLPRDKHLEDICKTVKITHVFERVIKNLSKGYRQRVGLAGALVGNPKVLILDEPTVGLDPKQIIDIRNLIKELGEKHTVILSSHILPEVQAVCERVIVIDKGTLVADDTPDRLSEAVGGSNELQARVIGPEKDVVKALQAIAGVKKVGVIGDRGDDSIAYTITCEKGVDVRGKVFETISENGWQMVGLQASEVSLEDIFLQLTGDNAHKESKDEPEKKRFSFKKKKKDDGEEEK